MKWNILETMFERIFRYLLKRYFGQYLEDFSLDKLSYGLSHGKGSVENVTLNVEALNDLSELYNLPVEFLSGSVDNVSILVPWTALLSENTVIELRGLKLIVQPKERPEDVSMFDSMWGSTTSSLQLAEDCLNSKAEDEEEFDVSDRSEGLENMARTIDAVLANMKIIFRNSSLKIEHVPRNGPCGVALDIKIALAEYFDEAGVNTSLFDNLSDGETTTYEPQAHSFKKVIFEGVSLFTAQFSAHSRTKIVSSTNYMDPSRFVPGSPEMPPTHSSLHYMSRNEPSVEYDPILISKLTGQQELRLKLKQNEAIVGPKVEVEFNFGAFNLFLIPKQVHMLYELLCGLMKPSSSNDNGKMSLGVINRPMRPADYALVEQELMRQQQKSDFPTKSLRNLQGWSSHSLEESCEELVIDSQHDTDFRNSTLNDNDSMCSSYSTDTRSDFAGNTFGNNQKPSRARGSTVQAMLQDQLSELTHFRGCCSSLCVIILHDDSVQESINKNSSDASKTNSNQLSSLKERAETFFDGLAELRMSGLDFKSFAAMREPLSGLCNTNHLRLLASSISIDGNEKSSSVQCIIKFSLSLYQFEVLECLFNSANLSSDEPQAATYVEILSCNNKVRTDESSIALKEACFKLKYQKIEYTIQQRHIKPPSNKLEIQFGSLASELDISLTDRIQTLLNFHNSFGQMDMKTDWNGPDVTTRCSPKTEVTISSPNVRINLRFPIPDLRSVHDMDRVPWWQQNLHPEIVIIDAKDVTFITCLDGCDLQAKYEIQCKDLHGLLQLPEVDEPIAFLRVSVDPEVEEVFQNGEFDWPRLVIHKTTKTLDLEPPCLDHEEVFSYSLSDVLMSNIDTDLSPFQSTSVSYASKIKDRNNEAELEKNAHPSHHEEVIKPADKETILKFMEQTVNKSEYLYEFSLPTVNMVLPSKEFFEMLINRFGNDFLLWEKTTLATKVPYDTSAFKIHVPGLEFSTQLQKEPVVDIRSIFKPISNDSNSDSKEEEANFYSVYEYCQKEKQKHKKVYVSNAFTKRTMTIAITKGNLTIHDVALDASCEILPDVCGKLQLFVEDTQIFMATSYQGDDNEAYLCVLADKSILYHDATAPKPSNPKAIPALKGGKPSDMSCIIYKSESGMCLKPSICDNSKFNDMLKIAVHIVRNPELLLKSFKVAIDISDATLRHYTHCVVQMWVMQLKDFLRTANYPVNGYTPFAVVTEFHLNLSNCAIDYRPLNLPLLSALTVENFNMSCNISASTPTFLFRIISDEMRLFISNSVAAKKVNLKTNYVCAIDSGLIDVSFRTSTDEKNVYKKELTITNNIIHMRSCADSFKALIDLIIYITSHGDSMGDSDVASTEAAKEEEKSPTHKSDYDTLHLEMAEAMKDCSDEERLAKENQNIADYEKIVNTDDEFCILEDDPGIGLKPRNGEPQIRMLTDVPIKIVDDYFSVPPGVSDLLKAPKHYPKPLFLFALREMSLVWHLYGGNDFKAAGKKKSAKNKEKEHSVTFSDTAKVDVRAENSSASFCKVTPLPKNPDVKGLKYSMEQVTLDHNREPNPDMWFYQGGKDRNQEVLMELQMNKIKFQREVYPLLNEYASRYILLIHDIEVRDRLKSSGINKFLYQYSSQKVPRQSHAYMVEVKAVSTRPDPNHSSEECSLHVSCKPLRLNVDQDSLIFLIGFFREVMGITSDETNGETDSRSKDEKNTPGASPKVNPNSNSDSNETFYRVFTFSPEVLIRIDYQGKHILMEQGALRGLMFGLGQLNASEILLKRLCYRHGLLGHHKLLSYATNEWQQDILKNQLPSILGGVGPMRSFVQLFQGIKDFFYLPVAQYQKDGQIVRGLQRGASSFSTSALMATLDLFSGLISAIQGAAIVGCDMVSPGPSVANRYQRSQETHRQTSQPADIREGIATALNVVKEGLGDTARTIYSVAYAEHEHKGVPGAVGGVLRQIPPCLFKPIILGSEATNSVLGGVRHQLMPDAHQEDIHKWRTKNS